MRLSWILESASNTKRYAHTIVPLRRVDVETLVMKALKIMATTCFVVFNLLSPRAQTDTWTSQQIESADLARNLAGWSDVEKDVVLHTNLVRMYPLKYLRTEVESYDYPEPYASLDKSNEYFQVSWS